MERILRQRDRLLSSSARLIGLSSTAIALVLLALPGVLPLGLLLVALPFLVVLAAAQYRMGTTRSLVWPLIVIAVGLATVVLLRIETLGALDGLTGTTLPADGMTGGAADAMRVLVAGATASAAIMLTVNLGRMLLLAGAFVAAVVTTLVVFPVEYRAFAALSTVTGWAGMVAVGSVLSAGLLRAARRISGIGRAHRGERQASETEAQRRQGARLLHDTVLATLTLLAHSGVGVSQSALRRQAADDARLLRQLRLSVLPSVDGDVPLPTPGGPAAAAAKNGSIERVRKRFGTLGLDVSWHGTDEVVLRPDRLEAFLLALSECLENVRRHSGVGEATVTVTDDEGTVRALVTDNGNGFDPEAVPAGKLGYRESIVARISEVGGTARVFSAAGAGTTVVLEVPR